MTLNITNINYSQYNNFNSIISNFVIEEKWDDMISFIQQHINNEDNNTKLKNALNNNLIPLKQSNIYNYIDNVEILKILIQLENNDKNKDALITMFIDNVNKIINYRTNNSDIEISIIKSIKRLVKSNIFDEKITLQLADKNIVRVNNFKYNHNLLLENIALDKRQTNLISGVLDDKIQFIQDKYNFLDKVTNKNELDTQQIKWNVKYNNIINKQNKTQRDLDIINHKQLIDEYFSLIKQKLDIIKYGTTKNLLSKAINTTQTAVMAYESIRGNSSRSFATNLTKSSSLRFLLLTKLGDKAKVNDAFNEQKHLQIKQEFRNRNKPSFKEIFFNVCLYVVKFFDVSGTRKSEQKLKIKLDGGIKQTIKDNLKFDFMNIVNKNINLLNKNKKTYKRIIDNLANYTKYSSQAIAKKVNNYKYQIDEAQKQITNLQHQQNNYKKNKEKLSELEEILKKQKKLNIDIIADEKNINKKFQYYSFINELFNNGKSSTNIPQNIYKQQINIKDMTDLHKNIVKAKMLLSKYDLVITNNNFTNYKNDFENDLKHTLISINNFAEKQNNKISCEQAREIDEIKTYISHYKQLKNAIKVKLINSGKIANEEKKLAKELENANIKAISDSDKKLNAIKKIQKGSIVNKLITRFFHNDGKASPITCFLALLEATKYKENDNVIQYYAVQALAEYQTLTNEVAKADYRLKLLEAQRKLQKQNIQNVINIQPNGIFLNTTNNTETESLKNEIKTDIINLAEKAQKDDNLGQIVFLKNLMLKALMFNNESIKQNNIAYCENYFNTKNNKNIQNYNGLYQQEYNKTHRQFIALQNIINNQQIKQQSRQTNKNIQKNIELTNTDKRDNNPTPSATPNVSYLFDN